jgi:hypothetical protein
VAEAVLPNIANPQSLSEISPVYHDVDEQTLQKTNALTADVRFDREENKRVMIISCRLAAAICRVQ